MATHNYTGGLRNVGSYQISGHPYITGSNDLDTNKVHQINFPYVSRSITVINNNTNNGEDIMVHFQSGSTTTITPLAKNGGHGTFSSAEADVLKQNHYLTIPSGYSSITMNVKCANFYISNQSGTSDLKYQVFAELTTIPTGSMYELTGSGITQ